MESSASFTGRLRDIYRIAKNFRASVERSTMCVHSKNMLDVITINVRYRAKASQALVLEESPVP